MSRLTLLLYMKCVCSGWVVFNRRWCRVSFSSVTFESSGLNSLCGEWCKFQVISLRRFYIPQHCRWSFTKSVCWTQSLLYGGDAVHQSPFGPVDTATSSLAAKSAPKPELWCINNRHTGLRVRGPRICWPGKQILTKSLSATCLIIEVSAASTCNYHHSVRSVS